MRDLENRLAGNENSRAIKSTMIRAFLEYCENNEAKKWKIHCHQHPKKDRYFMSEGQVSYARDIARELGVEHELVYSLAIDNGLRTIDTRRLTVAMAEKLLKSGQAMIIGKGRNGGKPGLLVLNQTTFSPLARYMKLRTHLVEKFESNPEELLIKERGDKTGLVQYSYQHVWEIWSEIMTRAGLEVRPHDGRATYGNRLRRKGVSLETIATLMRHESLDTTFKSYIGYDNDELRSAQDLLAGGTSKSCPSKATQRNPQ